MRSFGPWEQLKYGTTKTQIVQISKAWSKYQQKTEKQVTQCLLTSEKLNVLSDVNRKQVTHSLLKSVH